MIKPAGQSPNDRETGQSMVMSRKYGFCIDAGYKCVNPSQFLDFSVSGQRIILSQPENPLFMLQIGKKKEADVGTHRSDLRSLPGVFQAGHRYVLCTIYASGHPPTPSELRERSFFRHDASKTLLNPRFGASNPQICFRKISKITKK